MKIERSIIKKFRKPIWSKFISELRNIIIKDKIKLQYAYPAGKDSMLWHNVAASSKVQRD